ncbi:MAG TPA: type II toxin-antitoxin system RelE/ParE family toxin [Longimicrobiaceae bacterium]|nr:type II toxin-antitoxin system RelE/ParE family toxin [Longimicrobiaceae bacterium]
MIVHWTRTALRHPTAVHDYIAEDSPHYARETVDRLTRRSGQIGQFPYSGHKVPEYEEAEDVREVLEDPYRILYRIRAERVDVLAVIHTARKRHPRR